MKDPKQCVFAAGKTPDGLPCVIVGIGPDCWNHLREGKTNTIDLARIGLPWRLVLFGGRTNRDVTALFEEQINKGAADLREVDFKIPQEGGN